MSVRVTPCIDDHAMGKPLQHAHHKLHHSRKVSIDDDAPAAESRRRKSCHRRSSEPDSKRVMLCLRHTMHESWCTCSTCQMKKIIKFGHLDYKDRASSLKTKRSSSYCKSDAQ